MRAPIHDLHVSNLLTYASLACAMIAIAAAADDDAAVAGLAVACAAIADTFDGRFARRFARSARQARVGHELDSLVDVAAFGVAPIAAASTGFAGAGPVALISWIGGGCFLLAAVTRLAFYNLEQDDAGFVGLPAPAAALLCVTALLAPLPQWAAAWPLLAGGTLMVAPIAIRRPGPVGLAAFTSWALMLAVLLATRALRTA
jgi:CDP-diacylglycerol--serine O-phosphatidyltransferase